MEKYTCTCSRPADGHASKVVLELILQRGGGEGPLDHSDVHASLRLVEQRLGRGRSCCGAGDQLGWERQAIADRSPACPARQVAHVCWSCITGGWIWSGMVTRKFSPGSGSLVEDETGPNAWDTRCSVAFRSLLPQAEPNINKSTMYLFRVPEL